jgi:hypothetical protein
MPANHSNPMQRVGTIEEYRNYSLTIVAHGAGYLGIMSEMNAHVFERAGTSVDNLIQTMRSWVDNHIAEQMRQRGDLRPNEADYHAAVVKVLPLLSASQRSLMQYHAHLPSYRASVDDLLDVAGVRSTIQLILDYANIARRLGDALCYGPGLNHSLIDPIVQVLLEPVGLIVTEEQTQELVLLPEVGQAFSLLIPSEEIG